MTAHQLARTLLACKDALVVINGWGSDEGFTYEVSGVGEPVFQTFRGESDDSDTPKDHLGYPIARECIPLHHL